MTDEHEAPLPPVVDLMEALRASVAAAGGKKSSGSSKKATAKSAGSKSATARASSGSKPAPAVRSTKKASGSASTAAVKEDLTALSKTELYDRATELGVAGRSKMSRKELEDAVSGLEGRRAS